MVKEVGNSQTYVNECDTGILVGGMTSSSVNLGRRNIQLIQDCCVYDIGGDIAEVGDCFLSLFKPLQSLNGLLYRVGEQVILGDGDHDSVAKVDKFLCVNIDGKYQTFVQVQLYTNLMDDEQQIIDPYSGYYVVTTAAPIQMIFKVSSLSRKVMLFPFNLPNNPDAMIVIDYSRKSLPSEVNNISVPFYPELHDMVLIRGDDPDPWLAKVVGIQERAKTVRVLYYEEDI